MVEQLTILLAEAAIELFPKKLLKETKVKKYFARIQKSPEEIILDISEHNYLLKNLERKHKRGRPDITHLALLAIQGSMLAKKKKINVVVHTFNNQMIYVAQETRLPRTLKRFKGLLVQLFKIKKIPPNAEKPLLSLEEGTLESFIKKNKNKYDVIIEFSVKGEKIPLPLLAERITQMKHPLLVFGAFQKGHVETIPEELVDQKLSIFEEGLELFTVISHILASIEYKEELDHLGNGI